jgi:hypothetical protein
VLAVPWLRTQFRIAAPTPADGTLVAGATVALWLVLGALNAVDALRARAPSTRG